MDENAVRFCSGAPKHDVLSSMVEHYVDIVDTEVRFL